MTDRPTDPSADAPRPGTPPTPGERRLAHPPSDRYRALEPPPVERRAGSQARGVAFAVVAALAGAAAITVIGGVLAVSAGLLVVAAAIGWVVALSLRYGVGAAGSLGRPAAVAVGLAVGAVVLGQTGLWLYARSEGGVLGPLDYLGETFGLLVPLEVVAAAGTAWIVAR